MTEQQFFAILGTDGPNNHDQGPEPVIREAQAKVFLHPGTGHLYRVKGYGWDSERDRWLMRYVRHYLTDTARAEAGNHNNYHHLPEDFFRPGRFLEVKA